MTIQQYVDIARHADNHTVAELDDAMRYWTRKALTTDDMLLSNLASLWRMMCWESLQGRGQQA